MWGRMIHRIGETGPGNTAAERETRCIPLSTSARMVVPTSQPAGGRKRNAPQEYLESDRKAARVRVRGHAVGGERRPAQAGDRVASPCASAPAVLAVSTPGAG